jgi:hypothetical protein
VFIPHWLNLRYVAVAFGTWCLLAGLGGWLVYSLAASRAPGGARRIVLASGLILMMLGAAADYRRFQRIFVRDATIDLSIGMLREADR